MGAWYAVGGAVVGGVSGGLVRAGADMVAIGEPFGGNTYTAAVFGGVGAGATLGVGCGLMGEARGYNRGFEDGKNSS